jgi:hypothetical protein
MLVGAEAQGGSDAAARREQVGELPRVGGVP